MANILKPISAKIASNKLIICMVLALLLASVSYKSGFRIENYLKVNLQGEVFAQDDECWERKDNECREDSGEEIEVWYNNCDGEWWTDVVGSCGGGDNEEDDGNNGDDGNEEEEWGPKCDYEEYETEYHCADGYRCWNLLYTDESCQEQSRGDPHYRCKKDSSCGETPEEREEREAREACTEWTYSHQDCKEESQEYIDWYNRTCNGETQWQDRATGQSCAQPVDPEPTCTEENTFRCTEDHQTCPIKRFSGSEACALDLDTGPCEFIEGSCEYQPAPTCDIREVEGACERDLTGNGESTRFCSRVHQEFCGDNPNGGAWADSSFCFDSEQCGYEPVEECENVQTIVADPRGTGMSCNATVDCNNNLVNGEESIDIESCVMDKEFFRGVGENECQFSGVVKDVISGELNELLCKANVDTCGNEAIITESCNVINTELTCDGFVCGEGEECRISKSKLPVCISTAASPVLSEAICKENNPASYYCDSGRCIEKSSGFDGSSCFDVFSNAPADKLDQCPAECGIPPVVNEPAGELNEAVCKEQNPTSYYCDVGKCIEKSSGFNGTSCFDIFTNASNDKLEQCPAECSTPEEEPAAPLSLAVCREQNPTSYYCDAGKCIEKSSGFNGTSCFDIFANTPNSRKDQCPEECNAPVEGEEEKEEVAPAQNASFEVGKKCAFTEVASCENGQIKACEGKTNKEGNCEYAGGVCTECGAPESINIENDTAYCEAGICVNAPGKACLRNESCPQPNASCNFPQTCDVVVNGVTVEGVQFCKGIYDEAGKVCSFAGGSCTSCTAEAQESPEVNNVAFCSQGVCWGGPGVACFDNNDCPQPYVAPVYTAKAAPLRQGQVEGAGGQVFEYIQRCETKLRPVQVYRGYQDEAAEAGDEAFALQQSQNVSTKYFEYQDCVLDQVPVGQRQRVLELANQADIVAYNNQKSFNISLQNAINTGINTKLANGDPAKLEEAKAQLQEKINSMEDGWEKEQFQRLLDSIDEKIQTQTNIARNNFEIPAQTRNILFFDKYKQAVGLLGTGQLEDSRIADDLIADLQKLANEAGPEQKKIYEDQIAEIRGIGAQVFAENQAEARRAEFKRKWDRLIAKTDAGEADEEASALEAELAAMCGRETVEVLNSAFCKSIGSYIAGKTCPGTESFSEDGKKKYTYYACTKTTVEEEVAQPQADPVLGPALPPLPEAAAKNETPYGPADPGAPIAGCDPGGKAIRYTSNPRTGQIDRSVDLSCAPPVEEADGQARLDAQRRLWDEALASMQEQESAEKSQSIKDGAISASALVAENAACDNTTYFAIFTERCIEVQQKFGVMAAGVASGIVASTSSSQRFEGDENHNTFCEGQEALFRSRSFNRPSSLQSVGCVFDTRTPEQKASAIREDKTGDLNAALASAGFRNSGPRAEKIKIIAGEIDGFDINKPDADPKLKEVFIRRVTESDPTAAKFALEFIGVPLTSINNEKIAKEVCYQQNSKASCDLGIYGAGAQVDPRNKVRDLSGLNETDAADLDARAKQVFGSDFQSADLNKVQAYARYLKQGEALRRSAAQAPGGVRIPGEDVYAQQSGIDLSTPEGQAEWENVKRTYDLWNKTADQVINESSTGKVYGQAREQTGIDTVIGIAGFAFDGPDYFNVTGAAVKLLITRKGLARLTRQEADQVVEAAARGEARILDNEAELAAEKARIKENARPEEPVVANSVPRDDVVPPVGRVVDSSVPNPPPVVDPIVVVSVSNDVDARIARAQALADDAARAREAAVAAGSVPGVNVGFNNVDIRAAEIRHEQALEELRRLQAEAAGTPEDVVVPEPPRPPAEENPPAVTPPAPARDADNPDPVEPRVVDSTPQVEDVDVIAARQAKEREEAELAAAEAARREAEEAQNAEALRAAEAEEAAARVRVEEAQREEERARAAAQVEPEASGAEVGARSDPVVPAEDNAGRRAADEPLGEERQPVAPVDEAASGTEPVAPSTPRSEPSTQRPADEPVTVKPEEEPSTSRSEPEPQQPVSTPPPTASRPEPQEPAEEPSAPTPVRDEEPQRPAASQPGQSASEPQPRASTTTPTTPQEQEPPAAASIRDAGEGTPIQPVTDAAADAVDSTVKAAEGNGVVQRVGGWFREQASRVTSAFRGNEPVPSVTVKFNGIDVDPVSLGNVRQIMPDDDDFFRKNIRLCSNGFQCFESSEGEIIDIALNPSSNARIQTAVGLLQDSKTKDLFGGEITRVYKDDSGKVVGYAYKPVPLEAVSESGLSVSEKLRQLRNLTLVPDPATNIATLGVVRSADGTPRIVARSVNLSEPHPQLLVSSVFPLDPRISTPKDILAGNYLINELEEGGSIGKAVNSLFNNPTFRRINISEINSSAGPKIPVSSNFSGSARQLVGSNAEAAKTAKLAEFSNGRGVMFSDYIRVEGTDLNNGVIKYRTNLGMDEITPTTFSEVKFLNSPDQLKPDTNYVFVMTNDGRVAFLEAGLDTDSARGRHLVAAGYLWGIDEKGVPARPDLGVIAAGEIRKTADGRIIIDPQSGTFHTIAPDQWAATPENLSNYEDLLHPVIGKRPLAVQNLRIDEVLADPEVGLLPAEARARQFADDFAAGLSARPVAVRPETESADSLADAVRTASERAAAARADAVRAAGASVPDGTVRQVVDGVADSIDSRVKLPVREGDPYQGTATLKSDAANDLIRFVDDPNHKVNIAGQEYTVSPQYFKDTSGRVFVALRSESGDVTLIYHSLSEGSFERFAGLRAVGPDDPPGQQVIYTKPTTGKISPALSFEDDEVIKTRIVEGSLTDSGKRIDINFMQNDLGFEPLPPSVTKEAATNPADIILRNAGQENRSISREQSRNVISSLLDQEPYKVTFNPLNNSVEAFTRGVVDGQEYELKVILYTDKSPKGVVNISTREGREYKAVREVPLDYDFVLRPADNPEAAFYPDYMYAADAASGVPAAVKRKVQTGDTSKVAIVATEDWAEVVDEIAKKYDASLGPKLDNFGGGSSEVEEITETVIPVRTVEEQRAAKIDDLKKGAEADGLNEGQLLDKAIAEARNEEALAIARLREAQGASLVQEIILAAPTNGLSVVVNSRVLDNIPYLGTGVRYISGLKNLDEIPLIGPIFKKGRTNLEIATEEAAIARAAREALEEERGRLPAEALADTSAAAPTPSTPRTKQEIREAALKARADADDLTKKAEDARRQANVAKTDKDRIEQEAFELRARQQARTQDAETLEEEARRLKAGSEVAARQAEAARANADSQIEPLTKQYFAEELGRRKSGNLESARSKIAPQIAGREEEFFVKMEGRLKSLPEESEIQAAKFKLSDLEAQRDDARARRATRAQIDELNTAVQAANKEVVRLERNQAAAVTSLADYFDPRVADIKIDLTGVTVGPQIEFLRFAKRARAEAQGRAVADAGTASVRLADEAAGLERRAQVAEVNAAAARLQAERFKSQADALDTQLAEARTTFDTAQTAAEAAEGTAVGARAYSQTIAAEDFARKNAAERAVDLGKAVRDDAGIGFRSGFVGATVLPEDPSLAYRASRNVGKFTNNAITRAEDVPGLGRAVTTAKTAVIDIRSGKPVREVLGQVGDDVKVWVVDAGSGIKQGVGRVIPQRPVILMDPIDDYNAGFFVRNAPPKEALIRRTNWAGVGEYRADVVFNMGGTGMLYDIDSAIVGAYDTVTATYKYDPKTGNVVLKNITIPSDKSDYIKEHLGLAADKANKGSFFEPRLKTEPRIKSNARAREVVDDLIRRTQDNLTFENASTVRNAAPTDLNGFKPAGLFSPRLVQDVVMVADNNGKLYPYGTRLSQYARSYNVIARFEQNRAGQIILQGFIAPNIIPLNAPRLEQLAPVKIIDSKKFENVKSEVLAARNKPGQASSRGGSNNNNRARANTPSSSGQTFGVHESEDLVNGGRVMGQDAISYDPTRPNYGAVFDGVSDGDGGPAARFAASRIPQIVDSVPDTIPSSQINDYLRRGRASIEDLSFRIQGFPHGPRVYGRGLRPRASTATVTKIVNTEQGQYVLIWQVGDTRAYLNRNGGVVPLTVDQRGEFANVVTSVLGDPNITVQTSAYKLEPGDRLILTTDGIHDNLSDQQIAAVIAGSRNPEADLIAAARAAGLKDDDMSVVILNAAPQQQTWGAGAWTPGGWGCGPSAGRRSAAVKSTTYLAQDNSSNVLGASKGPQVLQASIGPDDFIGCPLSSAAVGTPLEGAAGVADNAVNTIKSVVGSKPVSLQSTAPTIRGFIDNAFDNPVGRSLSFLKSPLDSAANLLDGLIQRNSNITSPAPVNIPRPWLPKYENFDLKGLPTGGQAEVFVPETHRIPGDPNEIVRVAHIPGSESERQSILKNGLWNVSGRDTLLLYGTPEYDDYLTLTRLDGNSTPVIVFDVPRGYLGYADEVAGGAVQGRRGLAIYYPADEAQNPELYKKTLDTPLTFSGGDATLRLVPLKASDKGLEPAYLPKEFVTDPRTKRSDASVKRGFKTEIIALDSEMSNNLLVLLSLPGNKFNAEMLS